jgi:PAS domain S-box-containing protein
MVGSSITNDELKRLLIIAEDRASSAEAALREGDARSPLLIETWAQAVWETDAAGVVVADSPSWRTYTGQTLEEWLGYGWLDAIHPDDRAFAERQWREAMAARSQVNAEFRLRAPDGGWRWTNVLATPLLDAVGQIEKWLGLNIDIDARKRAEAALRESEERYRSLFESMDEAYAVVEVLKDARGRWADFRFLEVNRAFLKHTTMPWPVGKTATELLGSPNPRWTKLYGQALDTGEPLRVEEPEATLGLVFDLNIFALDRDHNRVAVLFTNITERKKAEAALRESEERFQQFANASSGAIWIRNAETLAMDFVSPAIERIYGVSQKSFLGDMSRWAAMIVPEDRDSTLAHIERARMGEPAVHEFRIQRPSDLAFRWIRNTDFPLYDAQGNIERVGGIAEDVTDEKLSIEHQGVLLAELQHRVRNIMAVLRSITSRTAASATSVEDYAELMAGRLNTFARVQALLTRAANVGVGMSTIVHDELSALAAHANQFDVDGPDIELSPKAAETMTLAVHELTTNALKYGGLSVPDGKVRVRWEIIDKQDAQWLSFNWSESGAPQRHTSGKPPRVGFGSELIEGRIPYELNGRGKVTIAEGGAQCHLEFPLKEGASILETSAPQRATVFGGAIDMTGQADLTGQRILVVEDDYYLATDTARALQGAGAEILGPCATEDAARIEIANAPPTAAVLDINLRGGRSFDLAGDFDRDGVPFIFITGYD